MDGMTRSAAELLLAAQLDQAGIPYEREYRFHPKRRWRFDFVVIEEKVVDVSRLFRLRPTELATIAVEVEGGSYTGGHKRGRAYESDCDKNNEAMRLGWRIYRFTPAQVEDGRAIAFIQEALGLEDAA